MYAIKRLLLPTLRRRWFQTDRLPSRQAFELACEHWTRVAVTGHPRGAGLVFVKDEKEAARIPLEAVLATERDATDTASTSTEQGQGVDEEDNYEDVEERSQQLLLRVGRLPDAYMWESKRRASTILRAEEGAQIHWIVARKGPLAARGAGGSAGAHVAADLARTAVVFPDGFRAQAFSAADWESRNRKPATAEEEALARRLTGHDLPPGWVSQICEVPAELVLTLEVTADGDLRVRLAGLDPDQIAARAKKTRVADVDQLLAAHQSQPLCRDYKVAGVAPSRSASSSVGLNENDLRLEPLEKIGEAEDVEDVDGELPPLPPKRFPIQWGRAVLRDVSLNGVDLRAFFGLHHGGRRRPREAQDRNRQHYVGKRRAPEEKGKKMRDGWFRFSGSLQSDTWSLHRRMKAVCDRYWETEHKTLWESVSVSYRNRRWLAKSLRRPLRDTIASTKRGRKLLASDSFFAKLFAKPKPKWGGVGGGAGVSTFVQEQQNRAQTESETPNDRAHEVAVEDDDHDQQDKEEEEDESTQEEELLHAGSGTGSSGGPRPATRTTNPRRAKRRRKTRQGHGQGQDEGNKLKEDYVVNRLCQWYRAQTWPYPADKEHSFLNRFGGVVRTNDRGYEPLEQGRVAGPLAHWSSKRYYEKLDLKRSRAQALLPKDYYRTFVNDTTVMVRRKTKKNKRFFLEKPSQPVPLTTFFKYFFQEPERDSDRYPTPNKKYGTKVTERDEVLDAEVIDFDKRWQERSGNRNRKRRAGVAADPDAEDQDEQGSDAEKENRFLLQVRIEQPVTLFHAIQEFGQELLEQGKKEEERTGTRTTGDSFPPSRSRRGARAGATSASSYYRFPKKTSIIYSGVGERGAAGRAGPGTIGPSSSSSSPVFSSSTSSFQLYPLSLVTANSWHLVNLLAFRRLAEEKFKIFYFKKLKLMDRTLRDFLTRQWKDALSWYWNSLLASSGGRFSYLDIMRAQVGDAIQLRPKLDWELRKVAAEDHRAGRKVATRRAQRATESTDTRKQSQNLKRSRTRAMQKFSAGARGAGGVSRVKNFLASLVNPFRNEEPEPRQTLSQYYAAARESLLVRQDGETETDESEAVTGDDRRQLPESEQKASESSSTSSSSAAASTTKSRASPSTSMASRAAAALQRLQRPPSLAASYLLPTVDVIIIGKNYDPLKGKLLDAGAGLLNSIFPPAVRAWRDEVDKAFTEAAKRKRKGKTTLPTSGAGAPRKPSSVFGFLKAKLGLGVPPKDRSPAGGTSHILRGSAAGVAEPPRKKGFFDSLTRMLDSEQISGGANDSEEDEEGSSSPEQGPSSSVDQVGDKYNGASPDVQKKRTTSRLAAVFKLAKKQKQRNVEEARRNREKILTRNLFFVLKDVGSQGEVYTGEGTTSSSSSLTLTRPDSMDTDVMTTADKESPRQSGQPGQLQLHLQHDESINNGNGDAKDFLDSTSLEAKRGVALQFQRLRSLLLQLERRDEVGLAPFWKEDWEPDVDCAAMLVRDQLISCKQTRHSALVKQA